MVKCCVPCCSSNHSTTFNGRNIQFFRIPVEKDLDKADTQRGSKAMFRRKKNKISQKQRIAWLKICHHDKQSDSNNLRMCLKHFHSSILTKSDSNKYSLKMGAIPTIHLTKTSHVNEEFAEIKSLPRFVAS